MRFLVLQHLDIEPPGLIGELIADAGHTLDTLHLDCGAQLPADANAYDGAIIMGGPQSANDQSDYIRAELAWLRRAIADSMPVLGICLGAQLMARAAGARIFASPQRELGWYPVYHADATSDDPLFAAMPDGLRVFQWHGETFSLSDAMSPVATHPDVPAQAFRIGRGQYGMQFHVEVDHETIERWIDYGDSERAALGRDGVARLRNECARHLEPMRTECRRMTQAWLELLAPP